MIMKTLIRTFILFFCITGLASCYAGIPLKSGKSENNQTYEVSYLFEHDGVKVYRFLDLGNYVYFTTRGDVTSIKNDSTRKSLNHSAFSDASAVLQSFLLFSEYHSELFLTSYSFALSPPNADDQMP